jgi:hypothetical protein
MKSNINSFFPFFIFIFNIKEILEKVKKKKKVKMFRQIIKKSIFNQKRGFYSMPPPREPDPFMYGILALGLIYIFQKKNPPSF